MEDYPEELRTPPVALVSLISFSDLHPTISAFLHSEQPPINTLALPDFSKISIFSKKLRDLLDLGQSSEKTAGILKRDWLLRHRTRVPTAAAMFVAEEVAGDPKQWLQVCTDLDNLKTMVRGRNIKLVIVLVRRSIRDEISEDLMVALRKLAEIDSKYFVEFVQDDASELRQSLNSISDVEYVSYAFAEGQRFKDSIEIIALFRRASESFSSLKALRTAAYCNNRMAREYFISEDFSNAKQLFDVVVGLYRQEGWVTLVWESLGYLRECPRKLGSLKDFIEYSLEMAALPLFSSGKLESPVDKRKYGPAGLATILRREMIQGEVINIVMGASAGDGSCEVMVSENQPLRTFSSLKALRTAAYCNNRMAREYFISEDFSNAKQLFDVVVGFYR